MKKIILITFVILVFVIIINAENKTDRNKFTGPYLGQNPPGNKPKIFGKGFISKKNFFEFSLTMSPDGNEIYFTRRKEGKFGNRIFVTKKIKDVWTKPKIAKFTGNVWANEPHIAHDGKKIYFGSKLPLDGSKVEAKQASIWVAERINGQFSAPKHFESGLMYVSISNKNTMFVTDKSGSWPHIVKKRFIDGEYQKSEKLIGPDKQFYAAWHPYIAPDESYIIYEQIGRKNNTLGGDDLFISFKDKNGRWSKVINLGDEINSKFNDFCPYVSPDGKYLFFTRTQSEEISDIYWVSTDVIKKKKLEILNN